MVVDTTIFRSFVGNTKKRTALTVRFNKSDVTMLIDPTLPGQGKNSRAVCPECKKLNLTLNEGKPFPPHCFTYACSFNGARRRNGIIFPTETPALPDNSWREQFYAKIFDRALPITRDTLAADYFTGTRGIDFALIGAESRFDPAAPFYSGREIIGRYPAIIHAIRGLDRRLVSLQFIFLNPDAVKISMKFKPATRPRAIKFCAVQLHEPGEILIVGEGVESSLSLAELTGIPAWAALSATGLENFTPPPMVREIWIAEDYDPAGQRAAEKLARRVEKIGVTAKILSPAYRGNEPGGFDWNDFLRERKGTE